MIRTAKPPSVHSLDDPLSAILRPSPSESEQDRRERLKQEAEAKKISERIDEELNLDRERFKKHKQDVKVRWLDIGATMGHSTPGLALISWTSRIRKIHSAEAVSAALQPKLARRGAYLLATRDLL